MLCTSFIFRLLWHVQCVCSAIHKFPHVGCAVSINVAVNNSSIMIDLLHLKEIYTQCGV